MIIATPLDLPIIEPDDWGTFWDIWNTYSEPLIKVRLNTTFSKSKVGSSDLWRGIDIYSNNNNPGTAWTAPFVDISKSMPCLYNTISTLPFQHVYRVRLLSSSMPILSHTDDNQDRWSIRAYFHYTDTNDQWYFTKPYNSYGKRKYFHIPKETNWFAYNDKHCWHGTDYNIKHPKILLQVYTLFNNKDLINDSTKKYRDYTIKMEDI
jgi:hypothetical protein